MKFCRFKDQKNNPPNNRANKTDEKKKTKKKNNRLEKKAKETTHSRRESEEDSEEETSEEDSPKKQIYSSRTFRVGLKTPVYADLNEKLSNRREDQKKEWGKRLFKAYRAKRAKDEENSVVKR